MGLFQEIIGLSARESKIHSQAMCQIAHHKNDAESVGVVKVGLCAVGLAVGIMTPAQASVPNGDISMGTDSNISMGTDSDYLPTSTLLIDAAARNAALSLEAVRNERARREKLQKLQAGARRARLERAQLEQTQLEQARLEQQQLEQQRLEQSLPIQHPFQQPSNANTANYPADGVYLYGQQPIAAQPATTYFVFEAQASQVTGAFYMTSSSFDCVQGQMTSENMALNVTDSYSQETYAYSLAISATATEVASRGNSPTLIAPSPSIDGFYQLPVHEGDREILATCQTQ